VSKEIPPFFALVGPTASGKSQIALELAKLIPLEIISADSMQVYRGMDIGTAKPSVEEQKLIPHHTINLVEINHIFDTAEYLRHAQIAEEKIVSNGKLPLYAGGTGLYIRALRYGLESNLPRNDHLREELEDLPLDELQEKVAFFGAHGLNQSDWKNKRRLIRAVEICSHEGKSLVECRTSWQGKGRSGIVFCLDRDMDELTRRINHRIDQMMGEGLVDEVRNLLEKGLIHNPVAMQAIGYKEVVTHIEGKASLDECVLEIKIKTRQFAKRQKTWFSKETDMKLITLAPESSMALAAAQIARDIENYDA